MKFEKFGSNYIVRIDKGEEVLEKLKEICEKENIKLGSITGLGATNKVVLGLFNTDEKIYNKTTLTGPMEITSLVGNISTFEGKTYLHCHINVCNESMNVLGGHLNECYISATGEFVISAINGTVERELNKEIGLNLYKFLENTEKTL